MKQTKINNLLIYCFIAAAFIFFSFRLFDLINRQAVNILFFDQWDFLTPLFDKPTVWEMFSKQHGPHRQGLGLFVSQAIGTVTGWNTRAECFGIGIILVLTAVLALILKKRLFGKLTGWDILIPVIILSVTQLEAVVLTPNPAHGALPLLLVVSSGLIITSENIYIRYCGLVLTGFLATYTGFGFFLGLIIPVILCLAFFIHWREKDKRAMLVTAMAAISSIALFSSFFISYQFGSVQSCYQPPYTQLVNYLSFINLELAFFMGFYFMNNVAAAEILGTCIFVVLIGLLVIQVWYFWKNNGYEKKRIVIFLLISFSLIFAVNSASGRICNGIAAAQTSRYMTLIIPGFLGIYFAFQEIKKRLWLIAANSALIVLVGVLPAVNFKGFKR